MGRRRLAAVCAAIVSVVVAGVTPGLVAGSSAGAAGDPYDVSTWTDPNGDRHLVRWNPCQVITYAVNPWLAGKTPKARAGAVEDVQRAFHRAAKRSGLSFRFVGRTTEVPRNASGDSWSQRQKSAEIVVAWVKQSSPRFNSNLLSRSGSGYVSGVGGWMLRGWTDSHDRWQAAVGRGFVVINSGHNHAYRPGFGAGVTRGALLLHEIGHALGLGHVGRTSELMYPTILRREHSTYQAGDERGLHKVGRRQGCIPGANAIWQH